MLHNRPHSGQGGSPGLPPPTWRSPMGPGAEGNLSIPPPITCFPPPPLGDPRLGTGPFTNTLRGRGRDGVRAVLFNGNWKRDHVLLCALSRKGGTTIALLYWPLPLSVITLSSLPSRVWINSGQSCRYVALKCHSKAVHQSLHSEACSVQ